MALEDGQDPGPPAYSRAPRMDCYYTVNEQPFPVTAPLGDSSRVPTHEHRVAASSDTDMTYSLLLLVDSRGSLHLIGLIRYNRE